MDQPPTEPSAASAAPDPQAALQPAPQESTPTPLACPWDAWKSDRTIDRTPFF